MRPKFRKRFFLYLSFKLIFLLALSFSSYSSTVFVNSVPALQTAINSAQAGDVIIWKDGKYVDVKINFVGNGSIGIPIVLKAQTAGNVSFSGSSKISLSGSYLL